MASPISRTNQKYMNVLHACGVALMASSCQRANGVKLAPLDSGPDYQDPDVGVGFEVAQAGDAELRLDFEIGQDFAEWSASRLPSQPPAPALRAVERLVGNDKKTDHWLFFTHHKTGTFLMRAFATSLGVELGVGVKKDHIIGGGRTHQRKVNGCQFEERVLVYQNLHSAELAAIREDCPHFRAIHMIREPLQLLVSGYLYHLYSNDTTGMDTGPSKLGNLSIRDGLKLEARAETSDEPWASFTEMVAVHETLVSDPRVVTIGLERFNADYNGTSRLIFEHLLGADYEGIGRLVDAVAPADVTNWQKNRLKRSDHVASSKEKRQALQELDSLIKEGDPDIAKVLSFEDVLRAYL